MRVTLYKNCTHFLKSFNRTTITNINDIWRAVYQFVILYIYKNIIRMLFYTKNVKLEIYKQYLFNFYFHETK